MSGAISYGDTVVAAIAVEDLQKAIKWYTGVLGLELDYEVADMGWAEVRTPVSGLTIGLSQSGDKPGPGGATITLAVKDIAAARKQLEDDGVKFDGETTEIPGMVKLANFADPCGNPLMLAESLAQR